MTSSLDYTYCLLQGKRLVSISDIAEYRIFDFCPQASFGWPAF